MSFQGRPHYLGLASEGLEKKVRALVATLPERILIAVVVPVKDPWNTPGARFMGKCSVCGRSCWLPPHMEPKTPLGVHLVLVCLDHLDEDFQRRAVAEMMHQIAGDHGLTLELHGDPMAIWNYFTRIRPPR